MDPGERRLLADMPLHAITARSGEAGLRERFAIEIAGFGEHDRLRLTRALELAARLHAADRRQSEPYVNHLLRVAIRISSHYRVRDAEVICAGLLHDAVEDHAAELAADGTQASALAALGAQFGDRVAELVGSVTNPGYQPGRDARQQYREHVAASLDGCPWARVIKASDFVDNGGGLIHATGPEVTRLAGKYAPLVPVLAELIARPDTPLSQHVKARILGQLDQAQDRFTTILAGQAGT
jgi:HD domain